MVNITLNRYQRQCEKLGKNLRRQTGRIQKLIAQRKDFRQFFDLSDIIQVFLFQNKLKENNHRIQLRKNLLLKAVVQIQKLKRKAKGKHDIDTFNSWLDEADESLCKIREIELTIGIEANNSDTNFSINISR